MRAPVPEHRIRMYELRQEQCMSQDDIADAAGISRNTMRRIEAGHSGRIGTRRALAGYFGVSVREIFPEIFDRDCQAA